MKNIKKLAIASALGLAVCGLAIAQVHLNGGLGHSTSQHPADPSAMVKHLSDVFPKVAAFDVNKDGQLETAEKEALGKAIADGTLPLPAHMPPHGTGPTGEMLLNHIADVYARVTPYDANHDGELDGQEQAAIKNAIEGGELVLHDGTHH